MSMIIYIYVCKYVCFLWHLYEIKSWSMRASFSSLLLYVNNKKSMSTVEPYISFPFVAKWVCALGYVIMTEMVIELY